MNLSHKHNQLVKRIRRLEKRIDESVAERETGPQEQVLPSGQMAKRVHALLSPEYYRKALSAAESRLNHSS